MASLPNALHTAYRGVRFLSRVAIRDVSNLFAYGPHTPRMHERIWVDPRQCETMNAEFNWDDFGAIRKGDWDIQSEPLAYEPRTQASRDHWVKIQACLAHWNEGISWEATGIYDHLLKLIEKRGTTDECQSIEDIIHRYQRLDEIFHIVRDNQRLSSTAELSRLHFREAGGIVFHVDRNLRPIFGFWGCHRFAMAITVGLSSIPAQVGVVHDDAKDLWRNHFSIARPCTT